MEPTEHRPTEEPRAPWFAVPLGCLGIWFLILYGCVYTSAALPVLLAVSIIVSFVNRRASDWIDEYGFASFEDFDFRAILVQLSAASAGITLGVLWPAVYAVLWVNALVAFCVSLSSR